MLASFRDLTDSISLHHNLFASSRERHPTLGGSPRTNPEAIVDFRNNVVYNLTGATNLGNCCINMINNDYRPGPDTPQDNLPLATKTENEGALRVFLAGNVFEGQPLFTMDNYRAIDFDRWIKGSYRQTSLERIVAVMPFDIGKAEPHTESTTVAYERVLKFAGASQKRDAADKRLVTGVRNRTHRMINSQNEIGGWPSLNSEPAPKDSDQDGMPDSWESTHGLSPNDASDRNQDRDNDGYTNLEEYLNSLCDRML